MIPLHIPRIEIQAGSNLKIDLTDNQVFGLENTWITDCEYIVSSTSNCGMFVY